MVRQNDLFLFPAGEKKMCFPTGKKKKIFLALPPKSIILWCSLDWSYEIMIHVILNRNWMVLFENFSSIQAS